MTIYESRLQNVGSFSRVSSDHNHCRFNRLEISPLLTNRLDDEKNWIQSQIDMNGRRWENELGAKSPLLVVRSAPAPGMEIGDFIWHFYISLWSFHTLTLVLRRLTNPKEYLRPQMELFSILKENLQFFLICTSWGVPIMAYWHPHGVPHIKVFVTNGGPPSEVFVTDWPTNWRTHQGRW